MSLFPAGCQSACVLVLLTRFCRFMYTLQTVSHFILPYQLFLSRRSLLCAHPDCAPDCALTFYCAPGSLRRPLYLGPLLPPPPPPPCRPAYRGVLSLLLYFHRFCGTLYLPLLFWPLYLGLLFPPSYLIIIRQPPYLCLLTSVF